MRKAIKAGFTLDVAFVPGSGQSRILPGVHYTKAGHAPLSGLCPTVKTARKAAEKASK